MRFKPAWAANSRYRRANERKHRYSTVFVNLIGAAAKIIEVITKFISMIYIYIQRKKPLFYKLSGNIKVLRGVLFPEARTLR